MSYDFLRDIKFWTAVADTVFSLALYLIGKFAAPDLAEILNAVIVAIQPIVLAILAGMFQSQNAALAAGYNVKAFRAK